LASITETDSGFPNAAVACQYDHFDRLFLKSNSPFYSRQRRNYSPARGIALDLRHHKSRLALKGRNSG
jgi:hypothetical protein